MDKQKLDKQLAELEEDKQHKKPAKNERKGNKFPIQNDQDPVTRKKGDLERRKQELVAKARRIDRNYQEKSLELESQRERAKRSLLRKFYDWMKAIFWRNPQ